MLCSRSPFVVRCTYRLCIFNQRSGLKVL